MAKMYNYSKPCSAQNRYLIQNFKLHTFQTCDLLKTETYYNRGLLLPFSDIRSTTQNPVNYSNYLEYIVILQIDCIQGSPQKFVHCH